MDFSIKGGGPRVPLRFVLFFLLKNHLESLHDCQNAFCTNFELYVIHIYVVVEVTLSRAEYGSQRSDQPENVNFDSIIRGLKNDHFEWDQV